MFISIFFFFLVCVFILFGTLLLKFILVKIQAQYLLLFLNSAQNEQSILYIQSFNCFCGLKYMLNIHIFYM